MSPNAKSAIRKLKEWVAAGLISLEDFRREVTYVLTIETARPKKAQS